MARNSFPGSQGLPISCLLRCLVLQAKPDTVGKVCEIVRKQLALPLETDLTPEYFLARLSILPLIWSQHMGLEEFDISIEDSSTNITTVQEADLKRSSSSRNQGCRRRSSSGWFRQSCKS
ncbi:hypothetical protein SAY87_019420 [Trapa incisa]|uniref:Uncharacterized protein n=1 Tax=Trapa incisa TaxID=236973 RepID=A0AAN7Q2U7_9MYRT|nr:hypothetical protein SAY87_019420 [Trapa incisa]